MSKLVIPYTIAKRTKDHLLKDHDEHFAFFLAGIARQENQVNFLVKDVLPMQDEDLDFSYQSESQLKLETLLRLVNTAREMKLTLIEAHSHPFTNKDVQFSSVDTYGFKEFVPYMVDSLSGLPYAATVWGKESIDALYWFEAARPIPIDEVCIVGQNISHMQTTSGKKIKNQTNTMESRFARNVQAIGQEGQQRINNTQVAVAGFGGLGSVLTQELVYLGVRNFTIIEPDLVEESNLNRLVGARPDDVGKLKIDTAKHMIYSIAGKRSIIVNTLPLDIRHHEAIEALKQVDVIFGCVDNDGARLILNEIALAYNIPYFDLGVGIEVKDGIVTEAGGRVMLIQPDGPCLYCAKEINPMEASIDLASKEEIEARRKLGYVSGADVPSPSVISLNSLIASVATIEFKCLVTGLRPANTYTFYDMLEEKMVQRIVTPNPKCYECSLKGIGDKVQLERYSPTR